MLSLPKTIRISEKDLQSTIEKDLGQIEKGLLFVDRFVPVGSGIIDTLALDQEKNPVIIEYKVSEGEDEIGLLQALSYANWINKNPDATLRFIQERKPESGVESLGDVRIILVAPSFTDRTVQASKMIEPDIALKRYLAFEHPSIGKWLYFETVYDSRGARPEVARIEVYSIDDHFEGRYAKMRPIFNRIEAEAKKLGDDVRVEAKKYYIALRRTYNFAIVYPYTSKLVVGLASPPPEPDPRAEDASNWGFSRILHSITIKSENDVDDKFINWLRASYEVS
jgi:predicted transport protein